MAKVVRSHALSAVQNAQSGHVGIVLGAADIITTVYANFFRNGHDKFVMSAGHGSALLYSVLKLVGYNIPDLSSFRKLGGLPGHPESYLDGVSATTGPLGQGVGNAVGMAMAGKIKNWDSNIFCLCSDGDLMEGVAQESVGFAGRYKLNNLILLWDNNGLSIDGTALVDLDVSRRMQAAGWQVFSADGNDFDSLNTAIQKALKSEKPAFINCKTVLGLDSNLAGQSKAHGFALTAEEMAGLINKYQSGAGQKLWEDFAEMWKPVPESDDKLSDFRPETIEFNYPDKDFSTRELSGIYLEKVLQTGVSLIGGSADLAGSTNVKNSVSQVITAENYQGNFINYGVREHAMGAIMNGMAYVGLRPFGSTFLAFSDYMRPAIRLAALSELPVVYVFTHDSVAVGEDGPTHQPIEQLASLRLIPNLNVFRPCNMEEVAFAWNKAIVDKDSPTCIVLSRQKVSQVRTPHGADISKGAYVIKSAKAKGGAKITLIATGSEVPLAVKVAEKLGDIVQVVSMPSVDAFRRQDVGYKQKILIGFVIAIEAGISAPWFEFADAVVGIDSFGESGPGTEVYKYFGFDADKIAEEIMHKLKNA